MVYIYLANGFEEVEALAPLDLLRRSNVDVRTVGVTGRAVTGAHGICVKADLMLEQAVLSKELEMIVLPGGMEGMTNLDRCPEVEQAIDYAMANGIYIAAICASPTILGRRNLLQGRYAVCYPGMEKQLIGAVVLNKSVVVDENLITAKGMGVSLEFGVKLCEVLCGEASAKLLRSSTLIKE